MNSGEIPAGMPSGLTSKERLVAYYLQFNGDISSADLGEIVGLKPHIVQYTKASLIKRGILKRRYYINPYALGFAQYQLFFSSPPGVVTKNPLITYLKEHWRTAWFASVGGDFQYSMNVIARSPLDFSIHLDNLELEFREVFSRKSLTLISSFSMLSKKYLLTEVGIVPENVSCITLNECSPPPPTDEIDHKMIQGISTYPELSFRQISEKIGISRTTFQYRVDRLRELGVLLGVFHYISAARFHRHTYLLLIQTVGARHKVRKAIYSFAMKEPRIVNVAQCLGTWDYQLNIEVQNQSEVADITNFIYRSSQQTVSHISAIPVHSQQQSPLFLSMDV
jgi:DNA-binding Lrp family transcriptional regulator